MKRRRSHTFREHGHTFHKSHDLVVLDTWGATRYLVEHGEGYSSWYWLVMADDEGDAIAEVLYWCEDNAPGFLCNEEFKEEFDRAIEEYRESHGGREPEDEERWELHDRVMEENDMAMEGSQGFQYWQPHEWRITKNPSRRRILEIQDRNLWGRDR